MRKYVSPELDILEFDVDDVITASSPSGGSGDPGEPAPTEIDNAYGGIGDFDKTPPGGYF